MNNIGLILKTLFLNNFRLNRSIERKKGIKNSIMVVGIICGVILVPLMIFLCCTFGNLAKQYGLQKEVFTIILFALQSITLIYGTKVLLNALFFSKDNDFLGTLPVKAQEIFIAKFIYVYLTEMIITGSIGLLCVVSFGFSASLSAVYFLLALVAILIAPIFPMLLSSIILIPIMFVVSFLKSRPTLMGIMMMLFYIVFMLGYFLLCFNMGNIVGLSSNIDVSSSSNSVQLIIDTFQNLSSPLIFDTCLTNIVFVADFAPANIGMDLLWVAVFYIGSAILCFVISLFTYKYALTRVSESGSSNQKTVLYNSNSVIKALIKNDIKQISRDSSLLFLSLMQIVMAPFVIAVFSYINTSVLHGSAVQGFNETSLFFAIFIISSTNIIATSAFTREHKNLYILKMAPISKKDIINSKIIIAVGATLICTVLCAIVYIIFGLNIIEVLSFLAMIFFLSTTVICLQIKLDLDKPKLNSDNITQAVKNNPSAWISMLISLVATICILLLKLLVMSALGNTLLTSSLTNLAFVAIFVFSTIFVRNSLMNGAESAFEKLEI